MVRTRLGDRRRRQARAGGGQRPGLRPAGQRLLTASSTEILGQRALNRALLARQGLLARSATPVPEMVEQLVGMQAQVPWNPYVALWSRLEGFAPEQLSALIAERSMVRAGVMRATLHLLSARDALAIEPLTRPILAQSFKSPFGAGLRGADAEEIAAAARELLAQAPRTRAELSALLAPRWPDAEPACLGHAAVLHNPIVQVTPRGLWRRSGQTRWALAEQWLDASLEAEPSVEHLVLRYLAAFGPAGSADVRTWSRLTGLREVLERLRPRLRSFRDERGRELFDVPDGLLPDPGTPAPPRFLPEYDNVSLSHDDRSRVLSGHGPGLPFPRGTWIGTLLVDGFYRANWSIAVEAGAATLTIDRFAPLPGDPAGAVEAIVAEGEGLLELIAPEAAKRRVAFSPMV